MTAADWLKALTTVVAAGVGAWVAAQVALNRWRAEMIGRRRAELAEEALADFYRFRAEIVRLSRLIVRENTPEGRDKRWLEYLVLTDEVNARRHRFAAVFGAEAAAKPFATLQLSKIDFMADVERTIAEGEEIFTNILSARSFEHVDAAIAQMEAICVAAIRAEERRRVRWW